MKSNEDKKLVSSKRKYKLKNKDISWFLTQKKKKTISLKDIAKMFDKIL